MILKIFFYQEIDKKMNTDMKIFRKILVKAKTHLENLHCLVSACDMVKDNNLVSKPEYMRNLVRLGTTANNIHIIDSYSCYSAIVILCCKDDSKITVYHDGNITSCMTTAYLQEHFPGRVIEVRGEYTYKNSEPVPDLIIMEGVANFENNLKIATTFENCKISCYSVLHLYTFSLERKNVIEKLSDIEPVNEVFYYVVKKHNLGNICICTLYSDEYIKTLSSYAEKTREIYASLYNYEYYNNFTSTSFFLIKKYEMLLSHLLENNFVIWMNCDVFIMNNQKTLEDVISLMKDKDILLTMDTFDISTSVMVIKNSEVGKRFLRSAINFLDKIKPDHDWSIINTIVNKYKENIEILPVESQKEFNSYWKDYSEGDFIVSMGRWSESDLNLKKAREIMFCFYPYRYREESLEEFQKRKKTLKTLM